MHFNKKIVVFISRGNARFATFFTKIFFLTYFILNVCFVFAL